MFFSFFLSFFLLYSFICFFFNFFPSFLSLSLSFSFTVWFFASSLFLFSFLFFFSFSYFLFSFFSLQFSFFSFFQSSLFPLSIILYLFLINFCKSYFISFLVLPPPPPPLLPSMAIIAIGMVNIVHYKLRSGKWWNGVLNDAINTASLYTRFKTPFIVRNTTIYTLSHPKFLINNLLQNVWIKILQFITL